MLFNSYEFIFTFLPIALVVYYALGRYHHESAILWLGLVSVFFYGYWSFYSLPVLGLSIVANYFLGNELQRRQEEVKKIILILSIALNLLALAYFKYVNFFIDNTNILLSNIGAEPWRALNVILPIGISFFTFTQIAYLLDIYLDRVKKVSFSNYMLFVTFFPHLIAGPIIHHKQVMPQFSNEGIFKVDLEKIAIGVIIFVIGMAKKLLIADPLGSYADQIFGGISGGSAPMLLESWLGSFAYTFQLYFDFSGYSDMAVGLSLLFGIILPFNFNSPFKARSIIDFWQRWHISLTKYIGDYLYTPITLFFMRLGQSRSEALELFISLVTPTILIFLILGIWHGANWTFVFFGGMHGVYVVVNHLWRRLPEQSFFKNFCILKIVLAWICTFLAVDIAFVMFRSTSISEAFIFYKGMMGFYGEGSLGSSPSILFFLAAGLLVSLVLPNTLSLMNSDSKEIFNYRPPSGRAAPAVFAVYIGLLAFLCLLSLNHPSTFLYFQF